MFLSFPTLALVATSSLAHAASNPKQIFSDNKTWIENLAVRRSNGYILPAEASSPVLYQVNPVTKQHEVVHNFSDYGSAIMSIADVGPDLFLVNTMYCDIYQLACTPGTGITWQVDLRPRYAPRNAGSGPPSYGPGKHSQPARVKQLAKGPDPRSLLNGAAALNDHIVLMVDQALGGIWAVDINKGNPKLVITDPSMNDTSSQGNGVNGIRVRGSTLYFNNPSKGTLNRMHIDAKTGAKKGPAKVIASNLSPDDFEIDEQKGFAYLTEISAAGDGQLLKISLKDGTSKPAATGLAGPTTARWKEYGKSLYVATAGGYEQWLSGNPTVPSIVYQVDV